MVKTHKKQTKKKTNAFSQKRILIGIGVFVVMLMSITAISSRIALVQGTPAPVATWGDGTDGFYQQVLANNGDFEENAGTPLFDNQPVEAMPKSRVEQLVNTKPPANVLGLHIAHDGAEKWVEVDLSDFRLTAWEGDRVIYQYPTSTGRPGYNTPTGEFRVWRKVLTQRYKGGTPGTSSYYNLPNVPFSLFWGGENVPNRKGYAIHGAYWHNDFGIANRSSGCINLKPDHARDIYLWAGPAIPEGVNAVNATEENPGIRVVIHE